MPETGTIHPSDEPSECAPPIDKIKELLRTGNVVPDEGSKTYKFENYHANVIGKTRGYKDEAGYNKWDRTNKKKMATYRSWKDVDFTKEDAVEPEWMFKHGQIDGRGVNMETLRPQVAQGQKAMKQKYTAAFERAGRVQVGSCRLAEENFKDMKKLELKGQEGKQVQPEGKDMTILQLYHGALGAIGDLWSFGVSVVEASREEDVHMSWSIKKAQRIWYKLNVKYDHDVSKVTDCARISLVFSGSGALERAAKKVLESKPLTFKNRIAQPTPECYRDLMFTLAMPNGHICEVQLHIEQMYDAKGGGGHKVYKMARRVLHNPVVKSDTYTRMLTEKEAKDGLKLNSKGQLTTKAGEVLRDNGGEWKNGEPHGRGTAVYKSGNMYVGWWARGEFEGWGTMITATGDKMEGNWRNGALDGKATYWFASGSKYEGQFKAGLYEGQGTFTNDSGDKYVGQYKDDKKHGMGTYFWACGGKYVGNHKADKPHGEGTRWYAPGDEDNRGKYKGGFKAGDEHGKGTWWYADGRAEVGTYDEGDNVGEGARWSEDRETAWRMYDGKQGKEISLEAAAAIAEKLGLPVPYKRTAKCNAKGQKALASPAA